MTTLYILFTSISIVTIGLFYYAVNKHNGVLIFLVIWTLAISLLGYNGFFEETMSMPPRIALIIIPVILYVIYFYRKLSSIEINLNLLSALHAIRLPVEIGLFYFYVLGKIPVAMTYEGWNFDIFMGISSILLLAYIGIFKKSVNIKLLYYWNILGLVLLSIIVVTAVISAPTPFQLINFEHPNLAIKGMPFLLLPIVIVPVVVLSHLLALRKLKASF